MHSFGRTVQSFSTDFDLYLIHLVVLRQNGIEICDLVRAVTVVSIQLRVLRYSEVRLGINDRCSTVLRVCSY